MWLSIRSGEQTGRVLEVAGERFVVGRDEDCDLTLSDEKISRKHASFAVHADGRVVLQDLGSTNGTFVDNRRLTQPAELRGNEQVRVGDTLLLVSAHQPSQTPTTIGVMPVGVTAPVPPPPTGFTSERVILRRSIRRATLIGGLAAALALITVGVGAYFFLTSEDDPPPAPDRPATPEEIVDAIRPATVLVDALVGGQAISGGTGWVLDETEGLIVTNAHVVNGGQTFEIGVNSGNPDPEAELERRPVTVVASAPCEDLALLKVEDTSGLQQIELGSQADLRQGETVVALGFPASASFKSNLSATVGAVSVVRESFDLQSLDVPLYPNVIRTDAAINPGNSGGPLLDLDKTLVGVNSAGITLLGGRTIQGESFAIGVDRVKEVVTTLRSGESIGWTGAGFEFPTNAGDMTSLGLPAQSGLIVANAVEGTQAAAVGLGQEPALLVAVNGVPVDNTLPSYCEAVTDLQSGEQVSFTIIESGAAATTTVSVTLE
jgi:S1-C subfamily serine protease